MTRRSRVCGRRAGLTPESSPCKSGWAWVQNALSRTVPAWTRVRPCARAAAQEEEEEEEEEDLFVFNDTIEGPRAPAVKPGRVTQA